MLCSLPLPFTAHSQAVELQQCIFEKKFKEFKVFTLFLTMPSLTFSRAVFRFGALEGTGDVQNLYSVLGFVSQTNAKSHW